MKKVVSKVVKFVKEFYIPIILLITLSTLLMSCEKEVNNNSNNQNQGNSCDWGCYTVVAKYNQYFDDFEMQMGWTYKLQNECNDVISEKRIAKNLYIGQRYCK